MPTPGNSAPATRELTVDDRDAGVRLLDYLARTWPHVDRVFLRRLLQSGLISVNYMAVSRDRRVGPGDLLRIELPPGTEDLPARRPRSESSGLRILAEHPMCLAVDKPAGLPTAPDRAGVEEGVLGLVGRLRPDDDLRLAHRLDRNTSGCLLFAKGLDGARWLDASFRSGVVRKLYRALVEGEVQAKALEIRSWLGPDRRRPGKVAVVSDGTKRGRPAHTAVEVVEPFRGYTLLALRPTTGRGHQLRVHLRSIGHPIVADRDYGAPGPLRLSDLKRGYKQRRGVVETPLLARTFLHAARIEVPDPDGGAPFVAESALPPDLERVLEKLRRFAAPRGGDRCD